MARLAYDISVVNIHFGNNDVFNKNNNHDKRGGRNNRGGKAHSEGVAELPTELTLEIPRDFNERFKTRSDSDYIDAIESFVYNHLAKRFQRECTYCQIWIGDDLDVVLKRIEEARLAREAEANAAAAKISDNGFEEDEELDDSSAYYDDDNYDDED